MEAVKVGKKDNYKNEIITEHEVKIKIDIGSISPKHSDCYYDSNAKIVRGLIATTLATFCDEGYSYTKPVKCLEALGSTGICGLTWAKHLDSNLEVTINAVSEIARERIKENAELNNLKVQIQHVDTRIALENGVYSFIVLETFASGSLYLDAVFRRAPRGGVVIFSTTDDPALYCKTPEVALRNYGGQLGKTTYYREVAARLIVAGLARGAAVHCKAIRVLWTHTSKGLLTLAIQVDKGPVKANECLKKLKRLLHCNMCEERVFLSDNDGYVNGDPYSLLPCTCQKVHPGRTALELGPLWSAELFDPAFLRVMLERDLPWSGDYKDLVQKLLDEAVCLGIEPLSLDTASVEPVTKKARLSLDFTSVKNFAPPFYFNLHKNGPKCSKLFKTDRVVTCLRNSGFRASRTHFDPEAVKTNANLQEFHAIMSVGFIPPKENVDSAEF